MAHDLMLKCERKGLFKIDNKKEWKWVEAEASSLHGGKEQELRCLYCHGRVTLHKQQSEDGTQDHIVHKSRQDSENCRGGFYFKGEHKMSLQPVE
jgi:hypothetical protein